MNVQYVNLVEHQILVTPAQRRGGHPKNLLQDAAPDVSLRENRKQITIGSNKNKTKELELC